MDALTLGDLGEKYVFDLFDRAQRNPIPAPRGKGDIVLDGGKGISIEVKASLRGTSGRRRFQFCLRKVDRDGTVHTDIAQSDLVILLAYTDPSKEPVLFCVPSSRLTCKTLKLPSNLNTFSGLVSHYRNFDRALLELRQGV